MAKKAERAGKPLDADDLALWRRVAEDAKPLNRKRAAPVIAKPAPAAATVTKPAMVEAPAPEPNAAKPAPSRRAPPPLPELKPGTAAGVDARTAERLRRGLLPIEGRIDLHGYTQDEAHGALVPFLERAWRERKRCLLVITGKGRGGKDVDGGGFRSNSEGVLRSAVPRWLNEAGLRARVLAITPAQAKDGGGGALYVLLKRQRDGAS